MQMNDFFFTWFKLIKITFNKPQELNIKKVGSSTKFKLLSSFQFQHVIIFQLFLKQP